MTSGPLVPVRRSRPLEPTMLFASAVAANVSTPARDRTISERSCLDTSVPLPGASRGLTVAWCKKVMAHEPLIAAAPVPDLRRGDHEQPPGRELAACLA